MFITVLSRFQLLESEGREREREESCLRDERREKREGERNPEHEIRRFRERERCHAAATVIVCACQAVVCRCREMEEMQSRASSADERGSEAAAELCSRFKVLIFMTENVVHFPSIPISPSPPCLSLSPV